MIDQLHLPPTYCQHCHFPPQMRLHSYYLRAASMAIREANQLTNPSKNAKCVHPSHRCFPLFFPLINRVGASGQLKMIITTAEAKFSAGDDLVNHHPLSEVSPTKTPIVRSPHYPHQSISTVTFAAIGFIIATIFTSVSHHSLSYLSIFD